MLTFDNVRFQYDSEDFSIIDHLSFTVDAGEFVCVIGPSGCGKSTIFRLVNKLLTPAEGTVLVNGTPIEKQKNYCGYMPQQDMLFPWRTVKENLMLPMEIRGGISKVEMEQRADQALESVGLKDWGKKSPKELSGGMRQRAAFARTVLTGSDLLLLDEPFSALDYQTRLTVCDDISTIIRSRKKTAVLITHDLSVVKYISHHILVMYLGQMVEKSSAKELFSHHYHPYTKALLSAVPVADPHHEKKRILLKGELTSPINPKPGCRFASRCLYATEKCFQQSPVMEEIRPSHFVSCHNVREINQM